MDSHPDDTIARLCARHPEIAAAWLFGSVARGDAGPDSDVDVGLVFREPGSNALDHRRLLGDLGWSLAKALDVDRVDLVDLEAQGWVFRHRVISEGRLVYEADRSRRIDFHSTTISRYLDWAPTHELATRGRLDAVRQRLERS